MSHYQAFDPKSEVTGQMVFSMTKSILLDDIKEILKRHGMDNIDPKSWYPVQSLLDVFNEVAAVQSNQQRATFHFAEVDRTLCEAAWVAARGPRRSSAHQQSDVCFA